jgi:hypothetical protein
MGMPIPKIHRHAAAALVQSVQLLALPRMVWRKVKSLVCRFRPGTDSVLHYNVAAIGDVADQYPTRFPREGLGCKGLELLQCGLPDPEYGHGARQAPQASLRRSA